MVAIITKYIGNEVVPIYMKLGLLGKLGFQRTRKLRIF